MTTPTWPEWIVAKDGMKHFALSERELWDLIARNEITASKVGRRWRIVSASVQKYLNKKLNIHHKEATND